MSVCSCYAKDTQLVKLAIFIHQSLALMLKFEGFQGFLCTTRTNCIQRQMFCYGTRLSSAAFNGRSTRNIAKMAGAAHRADHNTSSSSCLSCCAYGMVEVQADLGESRP